MFKGKDNALKQLRIVRRRAIQSNISIGEVLYLKKFVDMAPNPLFETIPFSIEIDSASRSLMLTWINDRDYEGNKQYLRLIFGRSGQAAVVSSVQLTENIDWPRNAEGARIVGTVDLSSDSSIDLVTDIFSDFLGKSAIHGERYSLEQTEQDPTSHGFPAPVAQIELNQDRPSVAVIWDPSVLDAATYRKLVTLLGDLARAGGGEGVELVRSIGFGVPNGVGVPK